MHYVTNFKKFCRAKKNYFGNNVYRFFKELALQNSFRIGEMIV